MRSGERIEPVTERWKLIVSHLGDWPHLTLSLLGVVGLIGLSLRLWVALNHPPSGDELVQTAVAVGAVDTLLNGVAAHMSPPLSYLFTWMLSQTLQSSEVFLMRLPSVTFGTAAVLFQFWLVRALGGPQKAALMSALLMALSGYLIYHSAENRMYAQYLLASQLLLFCYVQYSQRVTSGWFFGMVVSAVSLTYLHYFAWLLLGGLVAHSALFQRRVLLRLMGALLVTGLLLAPWLIYALTTQIDATGQGLSIGYGIDNPIHIPLAILHLVANGIHDSAPRTLPYGLPVALLTATVCASLIGLGLSRLSRINKTHVFMVVSISVLPVLPILAWTALVGPIFVVKYLMFIVPVWYLLLALGLCEAADQVPWSWNGWALSIALLVCLPGLVNSVR